MKNIPILLLHGWNLSSSKYDVLCEELKRLGYEVFCFDLPGFGSSKILDKSLFLNDYLDYIEEFLSKKGIGKVILIGHSFGGRIGIKLAVKRPNLIYALILTGTPGVKPVSTIKTQFYAILAKIGNAFFSLPYISSLKNLARKLLYKTANASDYYYTPESLKKTFQNVVKEDLKSYLSEIKTPTLLLWGSDDTIVPFSVAQNMSRLINKAKLAVISQARHGLPWTHPKLFANKVNIFLKNLCK